MWPLTAGGVFKSRGQAVALTFIILLIDSSRWFAENVLISEGLNTVAVSAIGLLFESIFVALLFPVIGLGRMWVIGWIVASISWVAMEALIRSFT